MAPRASLLVYGGCARRPLQFSLIPRRALFLDSPDCWPDVRTGGAGGQIRCFKIIGAIIRLQSETTNAGAHPEFEHHPKISYSRTSRAIPGLAPRRTGITSTTAKAWPPPTTGKRAGCLSWRSASLLHVYPNLPCPPEPPYIRASPLPLSFLPSPPFSMRPAVLIFLDRRRRH